jgi:hypothetical protein
MLHPDRHAGVSVSQWILGAGLGPTAVATFDALVRLTTYVSGTSRSVLVPAWQRIATAARWPHHRSPPVST